MVKVNLTIFLSSVVYITYSSYQFNLREILKLTRANFFWKNIRNKRRFVKRENRKRKYWHCINILFSSCYHLQAAFAQSALPREKKAIYPECNDNILRYSKMIV